MDLEHKAIERLKMAAELSEAYYQKPLLLTYSGGKDSEVCLELCKRAEVPFEVVHSHTTADAPETVHHVRKIFYGLELAGVKCKIEYPVYKGKRVSMWSLIPQKLVPPTRKRRYCCSVCKEGATHHRCAVLGVRRLESFGRAGTGVAEHFGKTKDQREVFDFDNGDERIIAPCQRKAEVKIHPIVEWTDREVWQFLHEAKVPVNPCYAMGFSRVGCVGCPLAGKSRWRGFRQWPQFANLYRRAFSKMIQQRQIQGKSCIWRTGEDVFRWWMEDKNLDGQTSLFDGENGGTEG